MALKHADCHRTMTKLHRLCNESYEYGVRTVQYWLVYGPSPLFLLSVKSYVYSFETIKFRSYFKIFFNLTSSNESTGLREKLVMQIPTDSTCVLKSLPGMIFLESDF